MVTIKPKLELASKIIVPSILTEKCGAKFRTDTEISSNGKVFAVFQFIYRPGQANAQFSLCDTVWKFHYFCTDQNLREIDFLDSRSAKSTITTHFEALNF